MTATEDLKRQFVESLGGLFQEIDALEALLSALIVTEVAANEKLYDQQRYDIVFNGLYRLFGRSRVQFHQNIRETKSLTRYDLVKNVKEVLPERSKQLLLEIVDSAILDDCTDSNFASYLLAKIAIQLGM